MLKVLLVGEAWEIYEIHLKGVNTMETVRYENDASYLIEALEKHGVEVRHIPNTRAAFEFPTAIEELRPFDVVLFSDISANTLLLHPDTFHNSIPRPNRLNLIRQYVERGGGFGMIGGYFSFQGLEGKGFYHGTAIEEILPVSMLPYDDRREAPEGFTPQVVTPNHPILKDLPSEWPVFLGYNELQTKENSEVLMTVGADPFLAVRSYKHGRTAAFASDCAPHWATPAFLSWEYYEVFWLRLVQWLAKTL